jgi:hypothetical protein
MLLTGVAIAFAVYRGASLSSNSMAYRPQALTDAEKMNAITDEDLAPDVEETLRQLENRTPSGDD